MGASQLKLLSTLWAVGVVISVNSSWGWLHTLSDDWPLLVSLLIVLGALSFPDSTRVLRAAALSFVFLMLWYLPAVPNHRTVLALSGCALLVASCSPRNASRALWTLRWLAVVLYFFAFVAKLNSTYLFSGSSCASVFLREALQLHGIAPLSASDHTAASSAFSTAGVWSAISELVLIILLVIRKTRRLGVLLGIAFHILLATHYVKFFANFSGATFVLLLSWLDEPDCRRLVDRLRYWRGALLSLVVSLPIVGALAACGLISPSFYFILRYVLWSVYAWYLLYAAMRLCFTKSEDSVCPSALGIPLLSLIAIAVAFGISPYLGAKTRSGISMYSNLRVEPGYTNHLFLPESPDIFGMMRDSATVTAVHSQEESDKSALALGTYPFVTICSFLARMDEVRTKGPVEIEFLRHGQAARATRGGPLPADCPHWTWRKLLLFGPTGEGSENACIW